MCMPKSSSVLAVLMKSPLVQRHTMFYAPFFLFLLVAPVFPSSDRCLPILHRRICLSHTPAFRRIEIHELLWVYSVATVKAIRSHLGYRWRNKARPFRLGLFFFTTGRIVT